MPLRDAPVGDQQHQFFAIEERRASPLRVLVALLGQFAAAPRQHAGARGNEFIPVRVAEHLPKRAVDVQDRSRRELLRPLRCPLRLHRTNDREDVLWPHFGQNHPSDDWERVLKAVFVRICRCYSSRASVRQPLLGVPVNGDRPPVRADEAALLFRAHLALDNSQQLLRDLLVLTLRGFVLPFPVHVDEANPPVG
nr:hypothetical protein [Corallococcus sp. CA047B]